MKTTLTQGYRLLMACCLMLLVSATSMAFAQDVTVKEDGKSYKVEVKDGKVYVNGEEVEGDDSFVFETEGEGEKKIFIRKRGGEGHATGSVYFNSDDMDKTKNVWVTAPEGFARAEVLHEGMNWVGGVHGPERMLFMEGGAELMEMEREARELAHQAREAEGADKERLEGELRNKLDAIFDYKLEQQEERVQRLSEQLNRLEERLQERRGAREDIIERRQRQLLGEKDILEW